MSRNDTVDVSAGRATGLDVVALAQRLVAIDSVNPELVPGAAGETAIADFCSEWLGARGFEVTRLESTPGRPSVVGLARGSGGGRSLLLNGHLDTVGVDGYEGDPFEASVVDGTLRGRGSFDMKGGLAAILVAAARAIGSDGGGDPEDGHGGSDGDNTPGGNPRGGLRGDVLVALVADEEFGSQGTEEVLAAFSADAAIVAEPSGLELTLAHRGFAWFDVLLTGRAAHGSMPHEGIDAIAHATRLLGSIELLRSRLEDARPHPILGSGSVRVSRIEGGVDAATVAPSCSLTIERRTLPGETGDECETELRRMLDDLVRADPDVSYTLTRLVARGAFEAPLTSALLATVASQAERVLGEPMATRGEPFWTDAGLLHEAGIPCVVMGVDGGGAHATSEHATVSSILQLTDILEGVLREFCA